MSDTPAMPFGRDADADGLPDYQPDTPVPLLSAARSAWPDTYTSAEAKAWIAAMDAAEFALYEAGVIDEFGFAAERAAKADTRDLADALHEAGIGCEWNPVGTHATHDGDHRADAARLAAVNVRVVPAPTEDWFPDASLDRVNDCDPVPVTPDLRAALEKFVTGEGAMATDPDGDCYFCEAEGVDAERAPNDNDEDNGGRHEDWCLVTIARAALAQSSENPEEPSRG